MWVLLPPANGSALSGPGIKLHNQAHRPDPPFLPLPHLEKIEILQHSTKNCARDFSPPNLRQISPQNETDHPSLEAKPPPEASSSLRETTLDKRLAKVQRAKRNGAGSASPYQRPAAKKAPIFKFNTNLGQHILKNAAIADAIVNKANIQPVETVLEIGPGTGMLTTRILEQARSVIAVEVDPRMAAELSCRVQGTPLQRKLEVVLGDFIKVENDQIKPFDVCISNTPYQVTLLTLLLLANWDRSRCIETIANEFRFCAPTDLLAPRLQAPLPPAAPARQHPHGAARVRPAPHRPPG